MPRSSRPSNGRGPGSDVTVGILAAFILWGAIAYWTQFGQGLGVTGLNKSVFLGVYITNFVFFVGISHAGTLISAILRISKAEWRRPITRSAEVITVMVLFFRRRKASIDLGRPYLLLTCCVAHFQLPLSLYVTSITIYLTGSVVSPLPAPLSLTWPP